MPESIIDFLELGICVIPIEPGKKKAAVDWKPFQSRLPSEEEINAWPDTESYAVVAGKISGDLECIDVDAHHGINPEVVIIATQHIPKVIQRTRSGGIHMIYRVSGIDVGRNRKIAMRPATEDELVAHNAKSTTVRKLSSVLQLPQVLIETRGEGGYFLVAPSPGYEIIDGDLDSIPVITREERDDLIASCAFYDQMPQEIVLPPTEGFMPASSYEGEKSGAAYNRQVDVIELLRSYGWSVVGRAKNHVKVKRPGDSDADSSGSVFTEKNRAFIFSTSTCLPDWKALSPFSIYTYYEHGGDFSAAAKALGAAGFGNAKKVKPVKAHGDSGPEQAPPAIPGMPVAATESRSEIASRDLNFIFLGYEKTDAVPIYVFFSRSAKVIVRLTPSSMTQGNLLTIAPMSFWEMRFPSPKKATGFDVSAAQSSLIETSNQIGIYNPNRVRGRGVWIDSGRIVTHRGGGLVVDGFPVPLGALRESRYIYEIGDDLPIGVGEPLSSEDASRFLSLVQMLSFEKPIFADMVAGWCFLAPLSGMLEWRPHLWATGPVGSGKSWMLKNIIRAMLGDMSLAVQGNTTESGVRQYLKGDAIPVIFDEGEGNGERKAEERIQAILELVRSTSAQDGGDIIKGGADGRPDLFKIRSMFAFASVVPQAKNGSDFSRITQIGMIKNKQDNAREHFLEMEKLQVNLLTPEWICGFHARTISMAKTVLKNIKVFKAAVAIVLGEQRAGDQVGTLLAGAYCIVNDDVIDFDRAVAWVAERKALFEASAIVKSDEFGVIEYLADKVLTIRTGSGSAVDRSISDLIKTVHTNSPDGHILPAEAQRVLKYNGIKVAGEFVAISNSHASLKAMLGGTAWGTGHSTLLSRIPGAREKNNARFGPEQSRAVEVPVGFFLPKEDD